MIYEMQKANMLAENINSFIRYVNKNYVDHNSLYTNRDKLYQIKLLIEEFRFQIIADELLRINQYSWDERNTHLLVDQFINGLQTIDEYVKHHYHDLFLLSARLETLKSLSLAFSKKGSLDRLATKKRGCPDL
ncbi:hypothetical protein HPT25_17600 [Bacillus sp. BRMEA1]|uniref:hypothetical protein n=1 Tax=Neobacillus endophyticus TaxID=2738405 RepID=UPI0015663551|nr:hypothetical protein [Neobacillus endophyticus]NRD79176.1 hypothetical protein [Neobacillus endophyticus]